MSRESPEPLRNPTLAEIADRLAPFAGRPRSPAWAEIIARHREHSGFGELREPVDWNRLPFNQPVRVVYLVDRSGPVLRWMLPEDMDAVHVLGGMFQDQLERGEARGAPRSGWLLSSIDGIIVWR